MKRILVPTEGDFPSTAEVVIIGGGIVGVATAFWLSRAGLDTVVVEMREGLSTLTTPNSVESFRAQFTEPPLAKLATESIHVFENFDQVIGKPGYDIGLKQRGYLFLCDDPTLIEEVEGAVEKHHQLGVEDSAFLTQDEIQERFPYVSPEAVAGTFRPTDGWLSSHEVTQGFAQGSKATFLLQTKANGIRLDGGEISAVETTRGVISTPQVVNAAGPFAGRVGEMVGLDLPLRPVRRQRAYIAPHDDIPDWAPMTIDITRDAYFRPETGGALIGWVDPEEPESEPSENVPTDPYFAARTMDKLSTLCPFWKEVAAELKAPDVTTSAGYYVYTPDDQPLIGPTPEVPGFYLNCGYWAGVMLSPAAGKRVADLMTGKIDPQDHPLRPTRYQEGVTLEGSSFLRGH